MQAPLVYLQTQNAHGSWVTPTTARGARFEFTLNRATLAHLEACPANARLVCCATGNTLATKQTVRQVRAMLRYGQPESEPARAPRSVIRVRGPGHHTPIKIPAPKNHVGSWYAPVVMR
jgi:hypothetical protein